MHHSVRLGKGISDGHGLSSGRVVEGVGVRNGGVGRQAVDGDAGMGWEGCGRSSLGWFYATTRKFPLARLFLKFSLILFKLVPFCSNLCLVIKVCNSNQTCAILFEHMAFEVTSIIK
jgi:hypothetical protein